MHRPVYEPPTVNDLSTHICIHRATSSSSAAANKRFDLRPLPIKAAAAFHTNTNTHFTHTLSPRWTGSKGGGTLERTGNDAKAEECSPASSMAAHGDKADTHTHTHTHTQQSNPTKGR